MQDPTVSLQWSLGALSTAASGTIQLSVQLDRFYELGVNIAPVARLTHAQDEAAVGDNVTSFVVGVRVSV